MPDDDIEASPGREPGQRGESTEAWHRQEYARLVAQNRSRGLGSGPTDEEAISKGIESDKKAARVEEAKPPKPERLNSVQIILVLLFVAASAALITCSHGTRSNISADEIKGFRK